jgi:hypothetical protein
VVEIVQHDNVCRAVVAPAQVSRAEAEAAQKVASQAIECLEGAVGGTIAEMQVLADELVCAEPLIARRRPKKRRCEEAEEEQQHPVPSILQQVKKNITARMTEIERRMSSEIHDCMEPSAAFIQRKRRQRESDAFLNVIALFDDDL